MQPAPRRVKTIYSVIASPNRLEILRILNTKGPLSYSELKTLAGFKSKKESGKFAYHLRKLVRQMLISLNRAERKYTVTNLARLVLNLTRQIEEQSVIESGKLYVRTSRQTMEEFNADRILQALVREAGMPVELAQKITSETEARLYKFQTTYLTAPLIREMVNALLIEHGYEEYRHRLTRLGLPVYDVTELVNRTDGASESVASVLAQTSQAVFSEYLLLVQLPRDVADAHLAGEIHISNAGSWGLTPDTVFVDLMPLQSVGINLGGRLSAVPRIPAPTKLEDAAAALVVLASLLTREASSEISFRNVLPYFHKFALGMGHEELKGAFHKMYTLMATSSYPSSGRPIVSLQIAPPVGLEEPYDDALLRRLARAAIEGYREHVESVPVPWVKLVLDLTRGLEGSEILSTVSECVQAGGCIALSKGLDGPRAFSGIRKDVSNGGRQPESVGVLHSLSVNLPRLAHESNRDETYFRAKLALLLQLSVSALKTRRKIIDDMMKKGLLPALAVETGIGSTGYVPLVVNLVGLEEAIANLVGDRAPQANQRTVLEKTIETASKVVTDRGDKVGERAAVAIVRDEASVRFATLDGEKYGKSAGLGSKAGYSDVPILVPSQLNRPDATEQLLWLYKKLNGGLGANLDLRDSLDEQEVTKLVDLARGRLDFVRLQREVYACKNCGSKLLPGATRCRVCKSPAAIRYLTA